MKRYIRYFKEKSFWNIFLKGKLFFRNKKFGIYMSKEAPELYLGRFDDKVSTVYVIDTESELAIDLSGKDYVYIEPFYYIQINYQDGSVKKICYASDKYGSYMQEF